MWTNSTRHKIKDQSITRLYFCAFLPIQLFIPATSRPDALLITSLCDTSRTKRNEITRCYSPDQWVGSVEKQAESAQKKRTLVVDNTIPIFIGLQNHLQDLLVIQLLSDVLHQLLKVV